MANQGRRINWTSEEVILALELYLKCGRRVLGAERPEVIALSQLLNQLPIHSTDSRPENFRSPGSVERKLGNLRALDPTNSGVGLSSVSKVDRQVWDEFANDPTALEAAANKVRSIR